MKVVLISGHDAASDRKTGFHFWAKILERRGIDVDFITVGSSPVSLIKKGGKQLVRPFNQWVFLSKRLRKFTWMPPFHPVNFRNRFLNALSWPAFTLYPLMLPRALRELCDADVFIIESGSGPLLVPAFAKKNPSAKFIYNFSDRGGVVDFHPYVVHQTEKNLGYFSMIRLNAAVVADDFPPGLPTCYVPQAIDKALFDQPWPNPYTSSRNAISIGDMLFDARSVSLMAKNFPDWTFHLFGKGAKLPQNFTNVRQYGEKPYDEIVPYLKHADIGIAPYDNAQKETDYLSQSSLKLVQYTYCALPIVTPQFAAGGRDHAFGYTPGVESTIVNAFERAIKCEKDKIDRSLVQDWEQMIDTMLGKVWA